MTVVSVGLGWDRRARAGLRPDLDASAIVCDADGKALSDRHFVFYNNLGTPDGSVRHQGDNVPGGDGDDERLVVNLAEVGPECERIVLGVSIHHADGEGRTFGEVDHAYIRVVNQANGQEIARYDLSEDAAAETAVVFGQLYRRDGEWNFLAVGQGYPDGLAGIARRFGLDVSV